MTSIFDKSCATFPYLSVYFRVKPEEASSKKSEGRWDRVSTVTLIGTLFIFLVPFLGPRLDDYMPDIAAVILLLAPPVIAFFVVIVRFVLKIRRKVFKGRAEDLISIVIGWLLVQLVVVAILIEAADMEGRSLLGIYLGAQLLQLFLLWLWMLWDCIRYERQDKDVFISWLVSILVFSPPATLIYLMTRKLYRRSV